MANKKITDVDVVSTVSDADYLFVNQGQSIKQIKKSDIPKPIYTAEEVGALPNTTIIPTALPNPNALTFTGAATGSYNGSSPVEINIPEGGGTGVTVDTTLSVAGQAADAKATGDAISSLSEENAELKSDLNSIAIDIDDEDGLLYLYVNGVKHGDGVDVGGGATRYTITYNLAEHIISSNNARKVTENNSYTATISSNNSEYAVGNISVTMSGTDISGISVSENIIRIPNVTGDVEITVTAVYYPSVILSEDSIIISSGSTNQFGVKLAGAPTQNQIVSIVPSENVTASETSLTFTSSNYDTYQYVTVTGVDVDGTVYTSVTVRNSNPLMTDYSVSVTVKGVEYSDVVDMTIPEGQVVTTLADYTYNESLLQYGYVYLTKYNGTDTNIKLPATFDVDGTTYPNRFSNNCFKGNTTIQYLEIDSAVKHANSDNNFSDMPALIGLKYRVSDFTTFNNEFSGDYNFEWWDGMELNTNVTGIDKFVYCGSTPNTKLKYLPDLSAFTKITSWAQTFWNCTALEKVFGMPVEYENACNMNSTFYGCTSLKKAIVGANVTNAPNTFRFVSNTVGALEAVDVYADGLTSSNSGGMFTNNNSGAVVRAHTNTDTYTFLQSFVSSGNITLTDFSGSSVPLLVTWGDSTTSAGTSWTCWPDRLQAKLGASNFGLKNEAVSGEWTTSTSARQGGNTPKILESFTIPTSGSVLIPSGTVGTRDGRIFETYTTGHTGGGQFRPYNSFSPCTIANAKGTFTRTSGGYTFTRIEDGTAVTVPANTCFYSDADDTLNNSNVIMLINLGINSGWNNLGGDTSYSTGIPYAEDLLTQVQYMVDHFTAKGGTKYIVCGPSAGKFIEDANYLAIVQDYEELAETAFGSHWLNLRTYGIANGLTQNNLTATTEDTERMSAGKWPSSLLHGNGTGDLTHPNAYGANTQMMAFYEKGVALGYWS